jgi:hypothetical protein
MPPTRRVLLLGAETDLGRACAEALAAAGHTLALVAATTDAEAAFAVKRLATRVGAPVSQAIDATNEAAVRVMVRQVSKALGGLDVIVVDSTSEDGQARNRRDDILDNISRHGGRELDRHGTGLIVTVFSGWPGEPIPQYVVGDVTGTDFDIRWRLEGIGARDWPVGRIAEEVVSAVAAPLP